MPSCRHEHLNTSPSAGLNPTVLFGLQGQQTQHPAFQHVVNANRAGPNRHPMNRASKPSAYPRTVYDPSGYRNVNKRKATRRGDELVGYARKQGEHLWKAMQCNLRRTMCFPT